MNERLFLSKADNEKKNLSDKKKLVQNLKSKQISQSNKNSYQFRAK